MKTLSIVIPFYNEGERIDKTLHILKKGFSCRGVKLEKVIFVNDGSEDATMKLIRSEKAQLEYALKAKVKIISYFPNRGRGYAIRASTLITNTDYVLYMDADMSIPLSNLSQFVPFMEEGKDLLFGSKKKPGAKALIPRSFIRTIVGYGHSIIASLILCVTAWDFQGGFKMFSKRFVSEVFPRLSINRWGFDMEVIFLAKKLGYTTIELPIIWSHIESGSKVKLARDIYRSLREMIQIRINWFNQMMKPSWEKMKYYLSSINLWEI